MTLLGAYAGNSPSEVIAFETWLGRPVDHIEAHGGRADWADYVGSVKWEISLWKPLDRPVYWTIPMFADGGSLAGAASGAYDTHYLEVARALAASRPDDSTIYIRVGEEFNGDWMPWASAGHEQEFIAAYQHFVDTFRSVSDRFRFEWNVNVGDFGTDPAKSYPGDAYVDVIGMDFYYDTRWDPADPEAAWDSMVNRTYGLQWHQDFAAAHNKPTAYAEWGIMSDDAGAYVRQAAEWFATHDVLYQNYWNSNVVFAGKLSDGHIAATAAAYLSAFGPAISGTPQVDGSPLPEPPTPSSTQVPEAPAPVTTEPGPAPAADQPSPPATLPNSPILGADPVHPGPGNGSDACHVIGTDLDNVLFGGSGNDTLQGFAGNDRLSGGWGADRLEGGTGFDFACYSDARFGNLTVSLANPSNNTGAAKGDVFLSIEGLILGNGNDTAYGNNAANHLIGGAGRDKLYGMSGNDSLSGGLGADLLDGGKGFDYATYIEAVQGLRVSLDNPRLNTGIAKGDTFFGIEGLILGAGNDVGYGNAGSNTLRGQDGNDRLYGLGGNDKLFGGRGEDTLVGGAGRDSFVFDTMPDSLNGDRIADFSPAEDTICLDNAVFTALGKAGTLKQKAFWIGSKAHDASDHVIYDSRSGALYYDHDGTGAIAQVKIAQLAKGLHLGAADFHVI